MRPNNGQRRGGRRNGGHGGGHRHSGGGQQGGGQQQHGQNRSAASLRNQIFDSNGPDMRVRGNAFQVHEKYQALAKDALSSGDRVLAENYLQHAEHYFRIIEAINEATAAEQRARQASWESQPQPQAPYYGADGQPQQGEGQPPQAEGNYSENPYGTVPNAEGGQPQREYQQRDQQRDYQGEGRENRHDNRGEYRGDNRGDRGDRGGYQGNRNNNHRRDRFENRHQQRHQPQQQGGEEQYGQVQYNTNTPQNQTQNPSPQHSQDPLYDGVDEDNSGDAQDVAIGGRR